MGRKTNLETDLLVYFMNIDKKKYMNNCALHLSFVNTFKIGENRRNDPNKRVKRSIRGHR